MHIYNIKQRDMAFNLLYCYQNNQYNRLKRRLCEIDSIQSYDLFQNEVITYKKKGFPFVDHRYSFESFFYGYYQAILNFSDMYSNFRNIPLFSHMEHGAANIGSEKDPFNRNSISYCSSSEYRRDDIHTIAPNRMYISVGPYIHYATKIYDESEEKKIKERYGRTLLVFPFHTCENEETGKDKQSILFDAVYSKYYQDFDTVLVCAYWFDAGNPIFERYKSMGAKIVSAGFRGDDKFVRRLKTIISLSDVCVMDEPGTNLGFCYFMGKPTYLEKRECRFNDKLLEENTAKFVQAFYSGNYIFTKEQERQQKELYNYYWGGDCLRKKEELQAIFSILYGVLKQCKYNIRQDKVDRAIKEYEKKLLNSNLPGDEYLYMMIQKMMN